MRKADKEKEEERKRERERERERDSPSRSSTHAQPSYLGWCAQLWPKPASRAPHRPVPTAGVSQPVAHVVRKRMNQEVRTMANVARH